MIFLFFFLIAEGISGLPVECRVDDGHGGTQSLTDDRGCPTDPALVPRLRQAAPGHWATAFPAFSFPDTHIVHYTCLLMLCSGACPKVILLILIFGTLKRICYFLNGDMYGNFFSKV